MGCSSTPASYTIVLANKLPATIAVGDPGICTDASGW